MSGTGRRNRKPWSHKAPPLAQMTTFKVAIVTAPYAPTDKRFLGRDLRLVRAAIMYADHVQLISPGAQMIQQIAPLGNATGLDAAVMLKALDDETIAYLSGGDGFPEGWQEMLDLLMSFDADGWVGLGELSGTDLSELGEIRQGMDAAFTEAAAELRATITDLVDVSGYPEMLAAERAGLLTLTPMPVLGTDTDELVRHHVDRLKRLMRKGKNVHLVLDEDTAGLARAMHDEGKITVTESAANRMKRALTSEGLLDRLPAFPDTPLDELIDMRNDLTEPLTRYRREVDDLSRTIANGPLNDDIRDEIGDLYENQVAPALDDLREQYAEHGLAREAARGLLMDVKAFVYAIGSPAAVLGVAEAAHLSAVSQAVLTGGAVGAVTGQQAISAAIKTRDARRKVRSAGLYYLLEIDHRTRS